MILITGATGKLGGRVIETLLMKNVPANQIAALVRDENKAANLKEKGVDIRIGDYNNKPSLDETMKGIDKMLMVSGNTGNALEQHRNVVDAAKKAGVNCLAYTSNCLRDRNTLLSKAMLSHFETEDYIIASGLNYTIFRNVLYMDSLAMYILGGGKVLETGINLPAGDGRVSYALRSDEAEAIGNVLAGKDCSNQIYNFTGSKAYSFYDIADILSELSGKKITYMPIDVETYKSRAVAMGVPEHAVEAMTPFMTDIKNGQGSIVSADMEEFLGRKPVDLKEGLQSLLEL